MLSNLSPETLESLAQTALEAFWETIAKAFPAADTGDLSPETTIHLMSTAEEAIDEWVRFNVPGHDDSESDEANIAAAK